MSNSKTTDPPVDALVAALADHEVEALCFDWPTMARPEQLPPDGSWVTWLMLGGRGSGKTRAGAEWIRDLVSNGPLAGPIALVGETIEQARAIMVEGESGLLAVHPPEDRPRLETVRKRIVWPNGAEAHLMSGSDPERFRGPQFAAAWCDEIGKWPEAEAAWDMLQFTLRLGERPRQVATTTPRPTPLLRRLLADPRTAIARMRTEDNKANLAPGFLGEIVARYRNTHLGRQELDGEMIADMPGALWQRSAIERVRMHQLPPLERIVIGVDPPVSASNRSDACGIVVAAKTGDRAVVLEDCSIKPARPLEWARKVASAFDRHAADAVIVEVNQGGDLVREILHQIDPDLPVIAVHARRGKWLRAEPVAALYGQGRVSHFGMMAQLEDEMCAFGPNGLANGHSPDRLDALVWAISSLLLNANAPRVRAL